MADYRRIPAELPGSGRIAFGEYQFDRAAGQLWRGAEEIKLAPRACALLAALAERSMQVVTKKELIDINSNQDLFNTSRFAVEERDQRYSVLTRASLSCGAGSVHGTHGSERRDGGRKRTPRPRDGGASLRRCSSTMPLNGAQQAAEFLFTAVQVVTRVRRGACWRHDRPPS